MNAITLNGLIAWLNAIGLYEWQDIIFAQSVKAQYGKGIQMEIKCQKCGTYDDAYILEVWQCPKCNSLDYKVIDDKEYAFVYSDCFI